MADTPFDLDHELRRHGGSLRRLARELVRDAAAADDAVQETWLHAVRRPPAGDSTGGWLATVLRRVVSRARRGERRRARREEAVAREPVVADHAEVASRTELAQRLLAAVQALDEPYRRAVWQRYFEELPPREIAARTGVPLATVKSRLQRGLQQLRQRLGEEGESSDWRSALASAFGFEMAKGAATAATVAAWQGGVLMATGAKVAAVAGVAALAVWWLWPIETPLASPPLRAAIQPSAAASPSREPTATERELVALPERQSDSTAPAAGTEPVHTETAARIRGRVVAAESGQPLAGIHATLSVGKIDVEAKENPVVVTGPDGVFAFDVRVQRGPSVDLHGDERVPLAWRGRRLTAGEQEDLGDVAMSRGRRIRGRVVDQTGERIPPKTFVNARPLALAPGEREGSGHTEEDGTFVLRDPIPPGPCDWVVSGDFELIEPLRTEVTLEGADEVILHVRRRPQIRGFVVDERGEPAVGVRLSDQPGPGMVAVREDGTFTMVRQGRAAAPATTIFVSDAPGYAPHPPLLEVPWGADGVRIQLRRLPPYTIVVTDADGAPVEEFGVVVDLPGVATLDRGKVRHRGRHEGGELALGNVVAGQTTVRVVPSDRGWAPSDAIEASSTQPLRVVLQRRLPVRVVVKRKARGFGDVAVQLVRDPRPAGSAMRTKIVDPSTDDNLWPAHVQRVSAGTTDAEGVVSLLRDPDLDGVSLWLQAKGEPIHIVRDLVLADDGSLSVELPGFGRIAGVVDLRGRDHRTLRVEVPSLGLTGAEALAVAPDGTFEVRDVPAGPCRVDLQIVLAAARTVESRTIEVQAGDPTSVEFDLAASPLARASGQVRSDAPLPDGLEVAFFDEAGARLLVHRELDDDGRFEDVELVPGGYRVALRPKGSQPFDLPAFESRRFEVVGGETAQVDLVHAPRRLTVRLTRPDGGVVRRERVLIEIDGITWPSGPWRVFTPMVDEVLVLDPAPTVPLRFRNWTGGSPWSEFVVMPADRSEAEVTVVLPDVPR